MLRVLLLLSRLLHPLRAAVEGRCQRQPHRQCLVAVTGTEATLPAASGAADIACSHREKRLPARVTELATLVGRRGHLEKNGASGGGGGGFIVFSRTWESVPAAPHYCTKFGPCPCGHGP